VRRRLATGSAVSAVDQNVDSLLDTMANVVGILVVLMAVIQMTVNDAMKRIQVWESEEAVELRDEREDAQRRLDTETGADLTRTLELSRLREHLTELRRLPASADTLVVAASVASQRLRARRLEASIAEEQERFANLQILLAESEAPTEHEGIALRLPDPRPAPIASERLVLFARFGRVFDPRLETLTRDLQEGLRRAPRPVTRYFDTTDVGNEMLRWQVIDTAAGRVHRLDWRHTDIGESLEDLQSKSAGLRELLRGLDPRREFLHFYVWGDSFEVYLEARRIAEEEGFSAGWIPLPAGKPLELVKGHTPPTPVD